ncbi:MAG TPA: ADYC domain-containing protein [Kofleriaceae bacterium]|nr:ADYC domain-containing protein [Kofleriaceae bacterium]
MKSGFLSLSLASLVLSGCVLGEPDDDYIDDSAAEDVGETTQEVMANNGMSLNGMSLNGMSLNGMSLNGTQLTGKKASGATVTGAQLVGARMVGTLSDGSTLDLRIDSAATLPAPNSDVWAYAVRYALADGTWSPLCGESGGAPVLAIPLTGTWNYDSGVSGGGSWTSSSTSFTFGCRGTALAKCVEFGYKPWKTVDGVSLRNHHQACTRMIRADYCGDGTPWTQNGTQINIYDSLGIQTDAATNWSIDAQWTSEGALCFDKLRDFQAGKPTCWDLKAGSCQSTFAGGALLIDEYKKL